MKLKEQEVLNETYLKHLAKSEFANQIKQFLPRQIATPQDYYNSSVFSIYCMFKYFRMKKATLEEKLKLNGNNPECLREQLIEKLIKEEFPFYYIKKDFLDAANNTNPPDFKLETLHFPRNPIIFCYPAYYLKANNPNDNLQIPFSCLTKLNNETYYIEHWICDNSKFICDFNLIGTANTYLDLFSREPDKVTEIGPYFDHKNVNYFTDNATKLAVKILLILNSRPKLIEESSSTKQPNKNKVKKERFHPPLWIGLGYSIPREHSDIKHKSPIIHWRRGHLRCQRFGEERSKQKIIWIEPTIVGANS